MGYLGFMVKGKMGILYEIWRVGWVGHVLDESNSSVNS